ncbi:phosphoesterase family-domain-containing protein, partial [Penicillium verhagenii]|uniref:phosphoesterase family-domain-containing protein n=1 Tax=Penicillium verhagenii TaxID=1562060 RepID=UPI002545B925
TIMLAFKAILALILATSIAIADSLRDIEHVVIFMQENRSWDCYFGTMSGVRGFNDPNVQANDDGKSVWHQKVDPDMSSEADTLLPWYLGYQGGQTLDGIQCISAGDNSYFANQAAYHYGENNHWARNNTPWSWAYYKRQDIPVQFAIAEGWTAGDMYQESQITSTNPNCVTLVSGSINVPGSPQQKDQGGVYIDNREIPGCDSHGASCYPLSWKTIYEFYEEAGVSWQVYQDSDNFDDNPLAWFRQFQNADPSSSLYQKGMAFLGLGAFYEAAVTGNLPAVSFIVGPQELSEHPPWMPSDGAWLQKKVVDAVTSSPKYSSTLLMISFDETGGFGDHVTPFHAPQGTQGEWMEDPFGIFGEVFSGPGFRVPFVMVSPWTRGNRVFTERSDHNSQILFLEKWLTARGYKNIQTDQMVHWRREHMSDLVNALDLEHPDLSIPDIPDAETPRRNDRGGYVGTGECLHRHSNPRPPVPYGNQDDANNTMFFEDGFKEVVGYLTEGRCLVFEKEGKVLTIPSSEDADQYIRMDYDANGHKEKAHRWVIHYHNGEESGLFTISSAVDGQWICGDGHTAGSDNPGTAERIRITFLGNGDGYDLQYARTGQHITTGYDGNLMLADSKSVPERGFKIYSVTYHN